jgi:lipopolysaccharide transport system ATP-binding protein
MTALKSLCERAIWLDKGRVMEDGQAGQVVLNYLQKGAVSTMEQVWEDEATAPGNEKIRIRSARILSLGPQNGGAITIESPIRIEFEFWNNQPDVVLNFTMQLYTLEGTYVFAVASEVKRRPLGLTRETVEIPAHLLNDGIYSVTIQIVQDTSSTLYLYPEILVFEVLDSARDGNWFGKWPGVVRPKLEWISQSIIEDGAAHEYK